MGSKDGKYSYYVTVNGYTHDLPAAFDQALAALESANFHYGVGIGQNNRALPEERAAIQDTRLTLFLELEWILTLFSRGHLHRPGVPHHDVVGVSVATDQPPALSEWGWE